jgi:hypothetical protein
MEKQRRNKIQKEVKEVKGKICIGRPFAIIVTSLISSLTILSDFFSSCDHSKESNFCRFHLSHYLLSFKFQRLSPSGLESREYGRRDPSRWPRGILYRQKLALTSPTSGGRSVGIVRLRTQATEFSLFKALTKICVSIMQHIIFDKGRFRHLPSNKCNLLFLCH